jgi:hypothetical protein
MNLGGSNIQKKTLSPGPIARYTCYMTQAKKQKVLYDLLKAEEISSRVTAPEYGLEPETLADYSRSVFCCCSPGSRDC